MDKLFFELRKNEEFETEGSHSGGAATILFALFLLCISLFLFNVSLSLKQEESEGVSRLDNALLAFADSIEENEAVCAFLGIEDDLENEIY